MNNFTECSVSGAGCSFKEMTIPSEFITGIEGGEPKHVVQCEYCGAERPDYQAIASGKSDMLNRFNAAKEAAEKNGTVTFKKI